MLFIFYLAIACYLINRISFTKDAGLPAKTLTLLFLVKICAGIMLGWMSQKFYPQGNDYWGLNKDGWLEYKIMMTDPGEFFTNIFHSVYHHYDGFFSSVGSYWNDLKYNIILKPLAVFNIFSSGNYYINSLFFNFFAFFGQVALFRVFANLYQHKKWPAVISCFLLPSAVYFSSGIHKDLVVFMMIGFYCYALYFSVRQKFTRKRLIILCISFLSILLVRNYVAIVLAPLSIAFIISDKKKLNPWLLYFSMYALGLLAVYLLQLYLPRFQPLKVITQKQADFFKIPVASSQIPTDTLDPSLHSFKKNAIQALDHGFLRPYVWERPGKFLFPLAVELLICQLLYLWMIFFYRDNKSFRDPFVAFGIFFAVSIMLIIGFIIPNMGSIVRYRSIYLPFIIFPVLYAAISSPKKT